MQNLNFLPLHTTAEIYLSLGWSVIPLLGSQDASRPKAPAVEWKPYQFRRPAPAELENWFIRRRFGALGIVTGAISALAVMDFDSPAAFHAFERQHPDLARSQVIQTRRGFHIYFRLPPGLALPSRSGQGVDILSAGRYVVARPSIIDGHAYTLLRGGMPHTLTPSDAHHLTRFLTDWPDSLPITFSVGDKMKPHPPQDISVPAAPALHVARTDISPASYYTRHAPQGRNNALFRASLLARDTGWTLDQTAAALVSLHLHQPGTDPESPARRQAEAHATIQSAFSRPPRRRLRPPAPPGLSNPAREKLCQIGQTHTLRVLETLLQSGVHPGDALTMSEIAGRLKGLVGEWSIRKALTAVLDDGAPVFSAENPSPPPPSPANAASDSQSGNDKKCFFVGAEKPPERVSHRPAHRYILPSPDEIAFRLGVPALPGDPLTTADLTSAKSTRMALHRELIKRRPGIYPRRWLAARLGVCLETLDDYNRDIPLHAQHLFIEQSLSWANIEHVPVNEPVASLFLCDDTNKRYPALRPLAARLLKAGKSLKLMRQDANFYWYGDDPPDLSLKWGLHPAREQHKIRLKQAAARSSAVAPAPPLAEAPTSVMNGEENKQKMTGISPQWLYENVDGLSLKTACRLAETYSRSEIELGLSILQSRRNVRSPAGFLITLLRSNRKAATFSKTTQR